MEEQAVDNLHRALLDVLVRAVDRVPRLKSDDRLPAQPLELGSRRLRVTPVLNEFRMLLAVEDPDTAAEEHLLLGVHGCYTGMGSFCRPVAEARLLFLVVREGFRDVHDRDRPARLVREGDLLALDFPREVNRGGQCHRQRPGQAVGQVHISHDARVGRPVHETAQGTEGADGDHFEVGKRPHTEGQRGQPLRFLGQRSGLGLCREPIYECSAVRRNPNSCTSSAPNVEMPTSLTHTGNVVCAWISFSFSGHSLSCQ